VHTLGTLLEGGTYKEAIQKGDVAGLASAVVQNLLGTAASSNPLKGDKIESYEAVNRDSAVQVLQTFISSLDHGSTHSRAFVYISAEDIFRPWIPARYIETKLEAERQIARLCEEVADNKMRTLYIRPSLMYHPHLRPLTTPLATVLDAVAAFHHQAPPGIPTPARLLRLLAAGSPSSPIQPTTLTSIANGMEIPPIHVDHVAEAVCCCIERQDMRDVIGVSQMRDLIGWTSAPKVAYGKEG